MNRFETHPLTPDRWDDLVVVFGGGNGKGDCGRCWCQWWRLPREGHGALDRNEAKAGLRAEVDDGPPPGLLGYSDGDPIGWVRVGPRPAIPEWNRPGRLTAPLDPEDATDPSVWGISCFVVRAGRRGQGHMDRLLDGAIGHAQAGGARVLDACPVETDGRRPATALFHGIASTFALRGFREIARRRVTRPLLRLDLTVPPAL